MKRNVWLVLIGLLLASCNTLKYVPDDEYLLDRVKIHTDDRSVSRRELKNYLKQNQNRRFWGVFNLNLGIYNLSGPDTTRWINRTLRKVGNPPVIYDESLTGRSADAMENYLFSQGYFNAGVTSQTQLEGRKARVTYSVSPQEPYSINSYNLTPSGDARLDSLLQQTLPETSVRTGQAFTSSGLNKERTRLTQVARNHGYYQIGRDNFYFDADSALNNHRVDVRLRVSEETSAKVYEIGKVVFLLDVPSQAFLRDEERFRLADYDTVSVGEYAFVFRDRPFIRPRMLLHNCFVEPGNIYRAEDVERTYSRLNSMQNVKYVNIRFLSAAADSTARVLDAYIVLTPGADNLLSADVEGTNTAGDLGIAGTVSYQHLNLLRGAETFGLSVRGAYEALSSSFNEDYIEYGGEMSLAFPDMRIPFVPRSRTKPLDASTRLSLSYDNLSRPEFLRTTASAGWAYAWQNQQQRHTLEPFDLAYIYMPRVDSAFAATYLREGSYLRYSYEDQLVVSSSYTFSYSSVPQGLLTAQRTHYTLRARAESGGNLLYGIYKVAGTPDADGQYTIGNIPFSQYIKGEFEFARNLPLSSRSRLVWHAGLGLAYPYGNSKILPFEKRFYSGGANSVRGWSVRTLGPGTYKTPLSTIDFMNQSGDMKLDLNLEWRQKWAGILEGAFFVDAGNIWTLREYDNQPGGRFSFGSFYKEIACSVGMGLRFNFNFLLLRIDGGMKVYDPSGTDAASKWRISHISSWDDFALHLAIGYPF